MKMKNLHKLPIEYLWEGLVLKDNIYDSTGYTLLIPKGEVLTGEKLRKLYNFNKGDRNITVHEEGFYDIIASEHMLPEKRQELLEKLSGYSSLTDNVNGMLHNIDIGIEADEIDKLVDNISDKLIKIDPVTIFSCINFPRPMDEGLQRHSLNVALMNALMGKWLGLTEDDVRTLVLAGLLHDVGKTKIPEEIINSPRRLTTAEYNIVKLHPVFSYEMLGSQFGETVRDIARHHHEKLTGDGYPDGLKGDEISLLTRITTLSDIYDAMVAKRTYKEANLAFDVFDMLYRDEFKGLDRKLVMIFLKNLRKRYVSKKVLMSDGQIGFIRFIPGNDASHPIVEQGERLSQTDDNWYCKEIITM